MCTVILTEAIDPMCMSFIARVAMFGDFFGGIPLDLSVVNVSQLFNLPFLDQK